MEKDNKTIGIIILVAVSLLLGVILVQIVADNIVTKTRLATKTDTLDISQFRDSPGGIHINASKTVSAASLLTYPASSTPWKKEDSDCAISSVVIKNQSGSTLTVTTHYTWETDGNGNIGNLTLVDNGILNSTKTNTTTITYDYCTDDYIADSWQRVVLNMVPGFFAIGLIGIGIFVLFYILKKEGLGV